MKKILLSTAALLAPAVALAQDAAEAETADKCVAAMGLVDKIILYGAPSLVIIVAGLAVSKSWGKKAADNRASDVAAHERAGKAFGLLLGSMTFSGLLYVTSTQLSKAGTEMEGLCYPDGWMWVSGIFFLVSLILFIVTYMSAK